MLYRNVKGMSPYIHSLGCLGSVGFFPPRAAAGGAGARGPWGVVGRWGGGGMLTPDGRCDLVRVALDGRAFAMHDG